jgi:hypothetical protein
MAGAADVATAAPLEGLIGADLDAQVVPPGLVLRAEVLAELVVEALRGEISLLLGDPLLKPKMRRDDEGGYGSLLVFRVTAAGR